MKIRKNDAILLAVIAVVACACLLLYMRFGRKEPGRVVVSVDGKVWDTYRLSDDKEIKVNQTNVFVIENGEVRMKEATCPDQICVHHKPISKNKESIICLPNKVVIEITGLDEKTELDSITN